jgi:hypothetical protein
MTYVANLIMLALLFGSATIWNAWLVAAITCSVSTDVFQQVVLPFMARINLPVELQRVETATIDGANLVKSKIDAVCTQVNEWGDGATSVVIVAVLLTLVEIHGLLYAREMSARISARHRAQLRAQAAARS